MGFPCRHRLKARLASLAPWAVVVAYQATSDTPQTTPSFPLHRFAQHFLSFAYPEKTRAVVVLTFSAAAVYVYALNERRSAVEAQQLKHRHMMAEVRSKKVGVRQWEVGAADEQVRRDVIEPLCFDTVR